MLKKSGTDEYDSLMTPDRVNQNPVRMNRFERSDEEVSEFDGYEAAAN